MAYTSDPQTIADLVPSPELDDVRAFLLAYLSIPANQVSDWLSGAVLRTIWEIQARLLQDLCGPSLQALAANGYPDAAAGDSLTKVAGGWFGVDRANPTPAQQSVVVACDAAHGPYTAAQVAALVGVSTDLARYAVTAGAATLSSGSTVTVTMTAEAPARATGVVASLINALPGMSVQAASITVFGSGGDNDTVVKAAMDARFQDLSELPANDRLIIWALAAQPAPLITRFRRDADPAIPGGVLVTLADADGPVDGAVVTAVQDEFDDLSPITDNNMAQSASTHTINASGTVKIKAALLTRAQALADAAWNAAMTGAQIGSVVYLQTLREAVYAGIKADPGSNLITPALSGAGGDGNVALAATEVPIAGDTLTNQLTWVAT